MGKKPAGVLPYPTTCAQCGGTGPFYRFKNKLSDTSYQVVDMCTTCHKNARGSAIYIPHNVAGDLTLLPILFDYTHDKPACEVCGSQTGTQLHHFAPRHIFGAEAERWPKAYLCQTCHDHWHAAMAAHNAAGDCRYCKGLAHKTMMENSNE